MLYKVVICRCLPHLFPFFAWKQKKSRCLGPHLSLVMELVKNSSISVALLGHDNIFLSSFWTSHPVCQKYRSRWPTLSRIVIVLSHYNGALGALSKFVYVPLKESIEEGTCSRVDESLQNFIFCVQLTSDEDQR